MLVKACRLENLASYVPDLVRLQMSFLPPWHQRLVATVQAPTETDAAIYAVAAVSSESAKRRRLGNGRDVTRDDLETQADGLLPVRAILRVSHPYRSAPCEPDGE